MLLFLVQQYAAHVSDKLAERALEHVWEGDGTSTHRRGKSRVCVRTISTFYDALTWEWLARYNDKYWGVWGRMGGVCTDVEAPNAAGAFAVPGRNAVGGAEQTVFTVR